MLSPQRPRDEYNWASIVSQLLEHLRNGPEKYRIDLDRIYLTGFSHGGFGTYQFAASSFNQDNQLAAIAPVAGWSENHQDGCTISERQIPVWAFHGKRDNVIPYAWGIRAFNEIKSCSDPPPSVDIIFTAYDEWLHDSWIPAYDTSDVYQQPNIFEWLLSHTLDEVIVAGPPDTPEGPADPEEIVDPVDPVTGVTEQNGNAVFSVHPNPAHDFINITFDRPLAESPRMTIHNYAGQLVMDVSHESGAIQISHLPAGLYVLHVKTDSGVSARERLIKLK